MKGRSVAIWKFLTVLGASNSDISWKLSLISVCDPEIFTSIIRMRFNDVANLPSLRESAGNPAGSPLPNSSCKHSGRSLSQANLSVVFSRRLRHIVDNTFLSHT